MTSPIKYDYRPALPFLQQHELDYSVNAVRAAHEMLHTKTGAGHSYLGWIDLPSRIDPTELARIKQAAIRIRADSKALIVIGIGGSYLGARAAIEMLSHPFEAHLNAAHRTSPTIYYAGNNISSTYIAQLIEALADQDFSINVISKSGTTTEPAVAFRIFKQLLEQKYGKEAARKRIYATTDAAKGALKKLADANGYETFVIPDDIGGRYSVLTAVGLLPIAVAGIDVDEMIAGARDAEQQYAAPQLEHNPSYQYAAVRNALYKKGKVIEILANYEPSLHYIAEWWKQLYGESEGKDGKGIFPASVDFSTDLHSMGQWIQEGVRNVFETVLQIDAPPIQLSIPNDPDNVDGLNFLSGQTMDFVNKKAFQGTLLAHTDGGVPNTVIYLQNMKAYTFGYMVYFFEKACGMSGYLLGVNPFDQPGVEAYKSNMFALLGKPGFEQMKAQLEARLRGM